MFKKFGFTGESTFFTTLGENVGKGLYIICTTVGTILLGVGSAYAGSFEFETHWKEIIGFWPSVSLIIINPISSLIAGSGLFLLGVIGTFVDQQRQQKLHGSLKEQNSRIPDLEDALNSTQEEVQIKKIENK